MSFKIIWSEKNELQSLLGEKKMNSNNCFFY